MNAPACWVRFGLVEAFNAAGFAKQMFSLTAAETVAGEMLLTRHEREAFVGDEQVQVTTRRADRAIAIEHVWALVGERLEPDRAAMASARAPCRTATRRT